MSAPQTAISDVSVTFHLWTGAAQTLLVNGNTTVAEVKQRLWRTQKLPGEIDSASYVIALSDTRVYFPDPTPMADVFDYSLLIDPFPNSNVHNNNPANASNATTSSVTELTIDVDFLPANWRLDHDQRTRGLPSAPLNTLRCFPASRREAKALLNLYMWEQRYLVFEGYTLYVFKSQKHALAGEKAQVVVPLEGAHAYSVSNLTLTGSSSGGGSGPGGIRGDSTPLMAESTSSHQNLLLIKQHDAVTATPSPMALTAHSRSSKAVLLARSTPGNPVFASMFTKDDLAKPREGVLVFSFETMGARDAVATVVSDRHFKHCRAVWAAGARELARRNALNEQGIFRLAGNGEHVGRVTADLMIGTLDRLPYVRDSNAVADAIKRALRNMPEPPMTYALYSDWLALVPKPPAAGATTAANTTDSAVNLTAMQSGVAELMKHLPEQNRALVRSVLLYCHRASSPCHAPHSLMTPRNLAVVFAPVLLRSLAELPHQAIANQKRAVELVAVLIQQAPLLLTLPPKVGPYSDFSFTTTAAAAPVPAAAARAALPPSRPQQQQQQQQLPPPLPQTSGPPGLTSVTSGGPPPLPATAPGSSMGGPPPLTVIAGAPMVTPSAAVSPSNTAYPPTAPATTTNAGFVANAVAPPPLPALAGVKSTDVYSTFSEAEADAAAASAGVPPPLPASSIPPSLPNSSSANMRRFSGIVGVPIATPTPSAAALAAIVNGAGANAAGGVVVGGIKLPPPLPPASYPAPASAAAAAAAPAAPAGPPALPPSLPPLPAAPANDAAAAAAAAAAEATAAQARQVQALRQAYLEQAAAATAAVEALAHVVEEALRAAEDNDDNSLSNGGVAAGGSQELGAALEGVYRRAQGYAKALAEGVGSEIAQVKAWTEKAKRY